jgi:integrase
MSKPENSVKIVFVDYTPAQLHENQEWEIVYYIFNPFTEKLARKRNRVKKIKSITERRKLAKRMVLEINERLKRGWNPFLEAKNSKELTKLFIAFDLWFKQVTTEYTSGNMRIDTWKSYRSHLKMFKEWLIINKKETIFCYKLDAQLIDDFLDYRRYSIGNSARTRDNYLSTITTICKWMEKKKYLTSNVCDQFKKINKKPKNRILIPDNVLKTIFEYLEENKPTYLTYCMMCYYCFTRRTELSKIKVGDVDLENSTLFITGADSKNKKSAHVTIPKVLLKRLQTHIKDAKKTDFLFGRKWIACNEQDNPDSSTNYWYRLRIKLGFAKEIQWYSLKDTGITSLIIKGVPLKSVRDQARHHSISQTDEYIPRNMRTADDNILNN